jgi:hypothetical protein
MGKGGSAEREISVLLSLWWTNGERDDVFYRTNASGARFTNRKKSGKDTAGQGGDICAQDPIGKPLEDAWSIECKSGYGGKRKVKVEGKVVKKIQKRWDVIDLLDSKQKETAIEEMWGQCTRDALLTNRKPVLIFRRNQREFCIAIEHPYFLALQNFFNTPAHNYILVNARGILINIMTLEDFFSWIPDIRISLCKLNKRDYNKGRMKLNRSLQ